MRKLLTIFTVLFLFVIVAPALASDYNYNTEIDPQQFNKWSIENAFKVKGKINTIYVWVINQDKEAKLNRAVLKMAEGFLTEFICWNENDTAFSIMRRFKYNVQMSRYDEITGGSGKSLIK